MAVIKLCLRVSTVDLVNGHHGITRATVISAVMAPLRHPRDRPAVNCKCIDFMTVEHVRLVHAVWKPVFWFIQQ